MASDRDRLEAPRLYDRFREVSPRALRQTDTEHAPWLVVSGADRRYRELAVGRALLESTQRALARPPAVAVPPPVPHTPPDVDGRACSTRSISRNQSTKTGTKSVWKSCREGSISSRDGAASGRNDSRVVVLEGHDAAGKGGAIRRITAALDARTYHVVPIAAPTDEERAQPYLWRFWRHVPPYGRTVIFDRSWSGRVLVEGFAPVADWVRGYSEINDFEQQLVEHGAIVVKLWLAPCVREVVASPDRVASAIS